MKKLIVASMVLGILGGLLSFVFAWLLYTGRLYINEEYVENIAKHGILLSPSIPAGVLGILGGIIVRFRHAAGGILLLIGASFAIPNYVSLVLLIVAALVGLWRYAPESASKAVGPPYEQEAWERGNPATKV